MAIADPPRRQPDRPSTGADAHPGHHLLQTPTGLTVERVQAATEEELRALHRWHAQVSGDDDGRPWWPAAIRRMPFETRLQLASDPDKNASWQAREIHRVQRSLKYFILSYGSMQDEEGGPPIPFLPWPAQLHVVDRLALERLLIILKARQLGLTWIVLHEAVHGMGYDPRTPRFKCLALSKTLTDAQKLVARARRIVRLLPPFLRLAEDRDTLRSTSAFKLENRGRMDSLPGTPDAARSEQADLMILDEGAFYRNRTYRATWTAARSTIGRRGRARIISTGNGPPEAPGDGQGFAEAWQRARSGETDMGTVFLPASSDPRRTPAWRERERKLYLNPEDFETEHPETEDQALQGVSGTKVFSPQGINAAEALGRELDALRAAGRLPEPAGGMMGLTWDWGELTHGLAIWPLEQGGIYVVAEWAPPAGPGIEPGYSARRLLAKVREVQRMREPTGLRDPWPLIAAPTYDSAGVQSMKTFVTTVEQDPVMIRQFEVRMRRGVKRVPTVAVSFADYKTLGKDYLKYLFRRTAADEPTGVIAISPDCPALLRQLRGLEVIEDGSGRIAKGDDHGPDSLIAHAVRPALRFSAREAIPEQEMGFGAA